jgi:hypothetical protein
MRTVGAAVFVLGLWGLAAGCSSGTPTTGGDGGAGKGGSSGSGGAGGSGGGATGTTAITRCDIDMPATQDIPEYKQCIEYAVGYTASADKGCGILKGTYSTGPCDLTGSIGGCKQVTVAGTMTSYYYMSAVLDAQGVMTQCMNDGNATYVSAP